MKIFAVRDEDNTTNKAVAYLFYYDYFLLGTL